jgi:two-component system sensor histidine kinase/response regulator
VVNSSVARGAATIYLRDGVPNYRLAKEWLSGMSEVLSIQATPSNRVSILLVDDNVIARKLVAKVWEARGCTVKAVSSGKMAIEAFQKDRPDLVLMDCEMPGLDGYATSQKLRSLEETEEHTPIIALSLYGESPNVSKWLLAGMDELCVRPFTEKHADHLVRQYSL